MTAFRTPAQELNAILAGGSRAIFELSPEQFIAEAKERAADVGKEAQAAGAVFQKAIAEARRARLTAARAVLDKRASPAASLLALTRDEVEKQIAALLQRVNASRPERLTLAYRDGVAESDQDRLTLLADLAELARRLDDSPPDIP